MTLLVAIAVGGLPAASAQDTSLDIYSAIIDQYRNDPERAIEQATALSPATFTAPPGRGIADASGSVSEHLQAAMLMHLEAALILAKRKDGRAGAHIRAGQELGQTLGRTPDGDRAARSRAGTPQPADRLQRWSRYGELASRPRRPRPRHAR
jgi:hypothetical protein